MPVKRQKESLSSVKVKYFDGSRIIDELKSISKEILRNEGAYAKLSGVILI